MSIGFDHSPEMRATVDALCGAIDDAQRHLERARQVKSAVSALAITALRQRGVSDFFIRRALDISAEALTAAVEHPEPAASGDLDWELRADIEQLWMAVRRHGSVWMQLDEVTTSAQVVNRHSIDIGSWPLAVRALDTPGAEFTHQSTGEQIVVYSLQSRQGTPTIVNDAIASWDHQGEYAVEFVNAAGIRSPLDLSPFGLIESAAKFRRRTRHEERVAKGFPRMAGAPTAGRDAAESFGNIMAAIRRVYGPLPPYSELAATVTDEVAIR